jgi:hypothetical protein
MHKSKNRKDLRFDGSYPLRDFYLYWEIALEHATNLQIRTAYPRRCTPYELTYGKQPSIMNLRIFGCEVIAYREKDKRAKFTPNVDQCIYAGISPNHSDDRYKLLNIKTKRVIYRRQVFFNERSFPARATKTMFKANKDTEDTAEDIIGLHFEDEEGEGFLITGTSRNEEGELVVDYKNVISKSKRYEKPKGYVSTVQEVRRWIGRQNLSQRQLLSSPDETATSMT